MVQLINGLAGDVAAFRVWGQVTKDDYDRVVLPVVKSIGSKFGYLNLLLVINTELKNYTIGAWIQDSMMSLSNLTRFNRVALVADSTFVAKLTHLVDKFSPGKGSYKSFHLKEEQVAIKWVNGENIGSFPQN